MPKIQWAGVVTMIVALLIVGLAKRFVPQVGQYLG